MATNGSDFQVQDQELDLVKIWTWSKPGQDLDLELVLILALIQDLDKGLDLGPHQNSLQMGPYGETKS